ncbi:kynureninase [Paroceanicella profunda]|uniref:Kynureninase n=1 Tax=Paroceanicella profunda TaxID=2579971 RepID=A0A5B8FV37_9RHOB|nr:kynureninase [Paroceanicella profunda]QDL92656.1 kynureninase [Paroceanicella profunda]
MASDLSHSQAPQAETVFDRTRRLFHIPDGVIYLDGNSLGPMPLAAADALQRAAKAEWSEMLIRGWNDADWIGLPERVGARIAALIGAEAGSVMVGDTTSVNLFKVLSAALAARPGRRVILSDSGNFPTDLYVAQGLIATLGQGHELRTVSHAEMEAAVDAAGEDLAVLMLTQVDYRTGALYDMKSMTARAQALGALTVWDLAHSAGALPVELDACNADFAIGCGYKYLNGGPGAPAFLYVAPRNQASVAPALSGWMGHAAPFAFEHDYRPAEGVGRMRVGTPPILALSALEAGLQAWDGVSIHEVRAKSIALCDLFIELVEARCPELELITPREGAARGSQVSFRFEEGYAAMQALIARGVIGDFRAPDVMRFGFTPLYISEREVRAGVDILAGIMDNRLWDNDDYRKKAKVT